MWGMWRILTERFINDGSVIRKLNLDNIPLVQFFWFSWMDSLSMGDVRIFFIVSMYLPKANLITDSDLAAYVHEYDEYSGRRSLLIYLGLLCYTPLDETYPLLSQLLNSGFKLLILNRRVNRWTLNINEIKPRRVRSYLFTIITLLNTMLLKQYIIYKPLQIILLKQYIILLNT